MIGRRFIDAPYELRCEWTITLADGSEAQCGRRKVRGQLCTQHAKMHARWSCEYCGGNDELPPDHCMDCTRPLDEARRSHKQEKPEIRIDRREPRKPA